MSFPLLDVLGIATKVIDKFIPDPQAKAEAQLKLLQMQQSGELAQLTAETELAKGQQAINLEEAKNASLFVSGWRPFLGWVCGGALAYEFIIRPIVVSFGHPVPELPMGDLLTILLGMLGLGGLRTKEKLAGVA